MTPHTAILLIDALPTSSSSYSRPLLFSPSRNGTQLRTICKDDSYDFNLQETRDLPHRVEIKPVGAWGGCMAGVRGLAGSECIHISQKPSKIGPGPPCLTLSLCVSL